MKEIEGARDTLQPGYDSGSLKTRGPSVDIFVPGRVATHVACHNAARSMDIPALNISVDYELHT